MESSSRLGGSDRAMREVERSSSVRGSQQGDQDPKVGCRIRIFRRVKGTTGLRRD